MAATLTSLFGVPNQASTVSNGAAAVTPPPAGTVLPQEATPAPVTAQPTAFASPSVASPTSQTTASGQSVFAMIEAAAQPNPLNQYYQSTYHFRLFAAPDTDALTQSKASTIQDLNAYLLSVTQVTIAESGVTGFNIRDVQITTIPAGNDRTRASTGTTGTITITEPNGISFLDGLAAAGQMLQICNFGLTSYYLELTFLGYDETGAFATASLPFTSGGRWIWAIQLTTIQAKLNEGGGVYTVEFVCMNQPVADVPSQNIMRSPQPFRAVGDSIKTLFQDYITKLNTSWAAQNGGPLIVFEPINTQAISNFFANPPGTTGLDPGSFVMKAQSPETNPNRNWDFDNQNGTYTVNVTPGYQIQDFIVDAIKHTEEGQNLAKDNGNIRTQIDQSSTAVNSRGFRETVIWTVETLVTQTEFDTSSGNYVRHITFYVVPHYTQKAIMSATQVTQAKTPAVQQGKVQSLISNGFLRKQYDYVFTGLNTEVIEFDMTFNTNINLLTASFNGTQLKYDAFHQNARQAPTATGTAADDGNAMQASPLVTPVNLPTPPAATTTPVVPVVPAPLASPTPIASFFGVPVRSNAGGRGSGTHANNTIRTPSTTVTAVPGKTAQNPQTTQVPPVVNTVRTAPLNLVQTGTSGSNNVYVEDLLSQQTATNPSDYEIPISFWSGYKITENEAGSNLVGQYSRDQSIVGAIWAQCLYNPISKDYLKIKLNIRGDPYWLGQTNLHRQVNLMFGNVSVPNNDLPDWSTGAQAIFLYFRYPLQTGDDFKPALKSSQMFSGIYTVNRVVHFFADGVYKQELECVIDPLSDISTWSSVANATTGGAGSSSQLTTPATPAAAPTVSPTTLNAAPGLSF